MDNFVENLLKALSILALGLLETLWKLCGKIVEKVSFILSPPFENKRLHLYSLSSLY
jgi:hypothetical protein